MLGIFAWAMYRRWFVTGREMTDRLAGKDAEIAELRKERDREREDRITAQKQLGDFAPSNARVAEAVADLSEQVVRRLPDPYEERQRGR